MRAAGGPFVTGVEGDHHNVVGLSLSLLRNLLAPSSTSRGSTSGGSTPPPRT
nr:Maf family protein [Nocardioides gansuensis]